MLHLFWDYFLPFSRLTEKIWKTHGEPQGKQDTFLVGVPYLCWFTGGSMGFLKQWKLGLFIFSLQKRLFWLVVEHCFFHQLCWNLWCYNAKVFSECFTNGNGPSCWSSSECHFPPKLQTDWFMTGPKEEKKQGLTFGVIISGKSAIEFDKMFPNWTWLDFLDPLNPKHWWLQWVMSSYLWGLCSFFRRLNQFGGPFHQNMRLKLWYGWYV